MALGRMITGFITVIVGAALVPTLVTVINSSVDELALTGSGTNAETNIALTDISNTTLAIKSTIPGAVCNNFVMVNSSDGAAISSGNYSFAGSECTFIMDSSSSFNGSEGNLTYGYTYTTGTGSSSASLLELTILFFALGVMIAGVGTSVSGLVEYGLV